MTRDQLLFAMGELRPAGNAAFTAKFDVQLVTGNCLRGTVHSMTADGLFCIMAERRGPADWTVMGPPTPVYFTAASVVSIEIWAGPDA